MVLDDMKNILYIGDCSSFLHEWKYAKYHRMQNTITIFANVYIKKCSLFSGIMVRKFDPWMCIVEILNEIKQLLFRILPYKENVIQES